MRCPAINRLMAGFCDRVRTYAASMTCRKLKFSNPCAIICLQKASVSVTSNSSAYVLQPSERSGMMYGMNLFMAYRLCSNRPSRRSPQRFFRSAGRGRRGSTEGVFSLGSSSSVRISGAGLFMVVVLLPGRVTPSCIGGAFCPHYILCENRRKIKGYGGLFTIWRHKMILSGVALRFPVPGGRLARLVAG